MHITAAQWGMDFIQSAEKDYYNIKTLIMHIETEHRIFFLCIQHSALEAIH